MLDDKLLFFQIILTVLFVLYLITFIRVMQFKNRKEHLLHQDEQNRWFLFHLGVAGSILVFIFGYLGWVISIF